MEINELIGSYGKIILSTFTMYILILFTLKILGQKEIGDLNLQDFLLVLMMAETTQHAMLGENETLAGGIVSFITIFLTNKLVNYVFYKFPNVRRKIEKKPIILINNGEINKSKLKEARLTRDEFLQILREKGILSPFDVKFAIIESDGELSVIENKE